MSLIRLMMIPLMTCSVALLLSVTTPAGGAAQENATGEWVVVKEWSGGTGQTKTGPFPAPTRPWRVTFKSTAGERFGTIEAAVRTPGDDRLVAGVFGAQADEKGSLARSFQVDSDDKEYVIEVSSHGLQWRLAVEQRR